LGKASKTVVHGRNAKTGRFVSVEKARTRPSTHVVERVPKPGYGETTAKRSVSAGGTTLKGETLPPRNARTGSFTTRKSTQTLKSSVIEYREMLERLAKK
jgi:hypothetical protein